ncbi:hypothetical protein ACIRPK_19820 [Kitasatospora sp. NPDC101801]
MPNLGKNRGSSSGDKVDPKGTAAANKQGADKAALVDKFKAKSDGKGKP